MNATITSVGGRAPPGRNTPTPSAGSRSPAAARGSRAPAPGAAPARSSSAPGRCPASRSACRTHFRSVSAVQPIFPAIDPIAAHCDACSPVLEHQPHRPLPHLRRKLARSSHGSILSSFGASGNPGAVQTVPLVTVVHHLGAAAHRAIAVLVAQRLVIRDGALCRRGPATLEEVAVRLRTLGSRTWRHAQHLADRAHYRQTLSEERSGSVRLVSVPDMRDGPCPDGAQAPVEGLPVTGLISSVASSSVSNSPASPVVDATVADSIVAESTVADSSVADSPVLIAHAVQEVVADEALGDDRDVLAVRAATAEVNCCACQLPDGRSIAPGRDAWRSFIASASAADLVAVRRAVDERIGTDSSDQEGNDDTGWPWEAR